MKLMSEYNKNWHYVMLKSLTLASGWKWCHCLYLVSVYQLILVFLMTTAAVHK